MYPHHNIYCLHLAVCCVGAPQEVVALAVTQVAQVILALFSGFMTHLGELSVFWRIVAVGVLRCVTSKFLSRGNSNDRLCIGIRRSGLRRCLVFRWIWFAAGAFSL